MCVGDSPIKPLRPLVCAGLLAAAGSACAGEPNDMFLIRDIARSPEEVVEAVKAYANGHGSRPPRIMKVGGYASSLTPCPDPNLERAARKGLPMFSALLDAIAK